MPRTLTFAEALRDGLDQAMAADPSVFVLGLGVSDPKGLFGTTKGLIEKYGPSRVVDMPAAENGMTGIAIGAALAGLRPVMTHQRVDFSLLALEQVVNQAAKWCYMFAGQAAIPLVIRLIIGRGWGQGPQHSQSLQSWFAHIPGLKVVMPSTAADAKGLLVASIEDDNPVIILEHRWLYNVPGDVPEGAHRVPLGRARVARSGRDVTIVALSYMTLEALRAAAQLACEGISAEVIDLRSLRPLDEETLLQSIRKTGRLLVADTGWRRAGFAAEIVSLAAEQALFALKVPPQRVTLPDCPTPSSPALADRYYPRAADIEDTARTMCGRSRVQPAAVPAGIPLDVPDLSFTGPF